MKNKWIHFQLLFLCLLYGEALAATKIECPEKIDFSSTSLALEKPAPVFVAEAEGISIKLESAGLYRGPPNLNAELIGDKPEAGAQSSWVLLPFQPSESLQQDKRLSEFWISCRYARGVVRLIHRLESENLSKCNLRKEKTASGSSLIFECK